MAHVKLNGSGPGIIGLLETFPESARPLNELAETLLRAPSPLSRSDRELIAAYVSRRNGCEFCSRSHAEAARAQWPGSAEVVDEALNEDFSALSPLLRALLRIANEVQASVGPVSDSSLTAAREVGACDRMIHDTVLISAAFCMYNRYVDGLATIAIENDSAYVEIGKMLATSGYIKSHSVTDDGHQQPE